MREASCATYAILHPTRHQSNARRLCPTHQTPSPVSAAELRCSGCTLFGVAHGVATRPTVADGNPSLHPTSPTPRLGNTPSAL